MSLTVDPNAFPEPSLTGLSLSGLETEEDTSAFEAALEQSFAPQGEEAPPGDDVDEEEEEQEAPSEEESSPSGEGEPPAPTIKLGQVDIPPERAEALGNFYAWAQTDEGSAWVSFLGTLTEAGLSPQQVAAFLKPQGEPAAPAGTTPPEDDYADPEVKALRDQVTQQNQALEQLQQRVQANAVASMEAIVAKAQNDFVARHGLNPDEMKSVRDFAEKRNLVSGIGGTDAHSAVMEALEIAYWAMPDFRDKELTRRDEQRKIEAKKNRKLAAVGGTNGSSPSKPKITKDTDIRDAMAAELAEHMGFPSRTG